MATARSPRPQGPAADACAAGTGGGAAWPSAAARPRPAVAPPRATASRRFAAFLGPGFMVSVGYMDPGNWATAIAGGSRYGEALLAVVVASSLMAMAFQAAAARLGLAGGQDLAQACRARFGPLANLGLWLLCEAAIVACNLAEVLGMAIGLQLLTGLPLVAGVGVTVVDVLLILGLQRRGLRALEAVVGVLVATIALCFVAQLFWAHPAAGEVARGLLPPRGLAGDRGMLFLAVAIVGATVMPHNLYLHSALVARHRREATAAAAPGATPRLREAIRMASLESCLALGLALFVNAAILVLAATAFHRAGQPAVESLPDAYRLLSPLLGVGVASAVFGVGLVASGLSSAITGTLAGQVVMEGFTGTRSTAGGRALRTRLLAIGPAAVATACFGQHGASTLLILSQVVLSLQLPFALVPLLVFTTSRRHLGAHAFGAGASTLLWSAAGLVLALNVWLVARLVA
ncbi:MAG: Nramp family divalent metal transporter [Burkholderiaceae bacterium]